MRLLCRLGIHVSWYHSSSFFGSVNRCNYCDAPDDKIIAERIERASRIFRSLPITIPSMERFAAAQLRMMAGEDVPEPTPA